MNLTPQNKKSRFTAISAHTKEMLIALVAVLFVVISPGTVHAGLFSFIDSFIGQPALAQESVATSTPYNSQTIPLLEKNQAPDPKNDILIADNSLMPQVGPAGTIDDIDNQPSNVTPSFYVIQKNDTISLVAGLFNVSVGTIKSANSLTGSAVSPGQVLIIPPVSGLTYTIRKGDTMASIISKYKVLAADILEYNDMSSTSTLAIGDSIFIPGASTGPLNTTGNVPVHFASRTIYEPYLPGDSGPLLSGYYACPVVGSRLSQGLHGHNAVDLALGIGNPIYAAAGGTVIIAKTGGWNGGYGNYVVIAHPNGTETLYAHAEKLLVSAGEEVSQGQVIAKIGMTGETTGPHLHFEVRGAMNPFVSQPC